MATENVPADGSKLKSLTKGELIDLVRTTTVRLEAAEDDRSRLISWIETEISMKGDSEKSNPSQSASVVPSRKAAGSQCGGDGINGGRDGVGNDGDSHNAEATSGEPTTTAGKPDNKLDEITSLQLAWRNSRIAYADGQEGNRNRNPNYRHVRVGVGVIVQDPSHPTRLFAGTRRGSHGAGSVRFRHVTNDPMVEEDRHYVTIFVVCQCVDDGGGEGGKKQVPQNLEPEKCDGWDSYSWEDLRGKLGSSVAGEAHLFGPLRRLVEESPANIVDFLAE